MKLFVELWQSNSFIMAFVVVGILSYLAQVISKKVTKGRVHASAIAILFGLVLAYIGGTVTRGSKGLADIAMFSGIGVLGGSSLRDLAIISTAQGAKFSEIKKCGLAGVAALLIGIVSSYLVGAIIACIAGYHDAVSVATIASGTVTFVVGPVTGSALGAASDVIAISIAAGLVKSIAVMLITPFVAKKIGLTTPRAAMIYGGLMGTTSGTTAGLASTNPALVPYGAMTSTFYTGLGCLLCPSVLFAITNLIF